MKNLFTSFVKTAVIAAGLFGVTTSIEAQTYNVGDDVKTFVENEDYGILVAPLLSTDTELNNWAAANTNDQQRINGKWDPRAWYAVFEVNAPAAGKYGVQLQVRSTTNNWQVAFSSSSSLEVSDRVNEATAPTWEQHARAIQLSTVTKETIELEPAVGTPEDEDYQPAVTEDKFAFGEGEWETIFATVDLQEGHNYVTFWLDRHFLDDDSNMKSADGGVLGFYVKSLKVLPTESAAAAEVLQQATRRIWLKDHYLQMSTEANTNLKTDYATLLAAVAAGTYTASTTALQADIEATDAIEDNLRHGVGQVLGGSNASLELPFYYSATDGICENERGYYEDAPVIFEYTNGKDIVYKFVTTEAGVYYPSFYIGAQNNNMFHVNILAEDMETKVMPQWDIDAGTGGWQTYERRENPTIYKFEAEAGKTYFMTMHIDNYVNFRGITVRQVTRELKTYAETEALSAQAQDLIAKYGEGVNRYIIGGEAAQPLIDALIAGVDAFTELLEDDPADDITNVYYALQEAIANLEVAPKYNLLPSSEETPFDLNWYSNISNAGTKKDGDITQIDNLRSNGWIEYTIYNTKDQAYKMDFEFGSANSAALTFVATGKVQYEGETLEIGVTESEPLEGTGGWQAFEPKSMTIPALPEGIVTLRFSCKIDASYAGNPRLFTFTPIEGTEGQGAAAVAKAYEDLKTLYNDDRFNELIAQAEAKVAQYSDALTYKQNYVTALQKSIDNARDVQANAQTLTERANAYKALETAVTNIDKTELIEWQVIPATEENPFDISKGTFNKWQMEGGGNIGYAYGEGSVVYNVEVTKAGYYDMTLTVSEPGDDAKMRIIVTSAADNSEIYNEVIDVPNTGGWGNKEDIAARGINLPAAKVLITVYGEAAGSNKFVGNTHAIVFSESDPAGIQNLKAAVKAEGIYTLGGQKVEGALKKGIYIVGGKKIVVK